MMKPTTLALIAASLSLNTAMAQFITRADAYSPNDVSNDGMVSGYLSQASNYSIWNPDLQTTEDIGGVSPGDGAGGLAKFSTDGNFLSGTSTGSQGPALSRYDNTTGAWTLYGDLGYAVDGTVSGGYAISGDGTTVVGNSWANDPGFAYAHAVAVNTNGVIDLGSLYTHKSTRANAVNSDASVIVGYQDFNGPWKSAIWRTNPAGGYFPNEFILLDAAGDSTDQMNQMGQCSAVSADGQWVGGYGDFANNAEPWIWSEATGVINLGQLPNTGTGKVAAMSADGSVVVGWFDAMDFGMPRTPFIWTAAGGLQEFNDYVTNVLGISTGSSHVNVPNSISPNGMYIAGFGVDDNTFAPFAFRLDLGMTTGIHAVAATSDLQVYPNPTTGNVTIKVSELSDLSIIRADGGLVSKSQVKGDAVIDLSSYDPGVYTFILRSNGSFRTGRVVKY